MPELLKILIVDDTLTYRTILRKIIEDLPDAEVLNTAANGKIALTRMKEKAADLVFLDIEMPEMDGLETLQHLRKDYPDSEVVMVSGISRSSTDTTILALEAGALEVIPKPEADSITESIQELKAQLERAVRHVKTILSARQKKLIYNPQKNNILDKTTSGEKPATLPSKILSKESSSLNISGNYSPYIQATKVNVIAMGSSTGGPAALGEILPKLPGDIGVPILLVQHMPPFFTASLAASLNKKCALTVKEAEDGELVLQNTVYIAPGGRHMTVKKQQEKVIISLNNDALEHSCRPAVDVLFRSIANVYQKNILSVILTGMGSDGAAGVLSIKKQVSCQSFTQSEKSCVVFGMPQAVVQQKASDESVDLDKMAERILLSLKAH